MADVKIDKHDLNKLAQMFASELARVMPSGSKPKRGNHERKRDEKDESNKPKTETPVVDTDLTNKSLKQLTKNLSMYSQEMEKARQNMSDASHSQKEAIAAQSALMKSIVNHRKLTNKSQDILRDKIKDGIIAQSKMAESMIKGATTMRDLIDKIDDSADALSDYDDALKSAGASTTKNIKSEAQMRKVLTALKETTIGANSAIGDMSKASDEDVRKTFERVKAQEQAHRSVVNSASSTTQSFMGLYIWGDRARDAMKAVTGEFGSQLGWIGKMGSWAAAIGLVAGAIKGMYDDWRKLSGVGLANDFVSISGSSIKLGVTMEEFVKVMKDNQNQLAQLSLDGMVANIARNQDSLIALGESTDGAARGIAGFTENAIQAGVDVRNPVELQSSIRKQVKSFETLRALTGQTAEEFAKTNAQIMNNGEFTTSMSRLGKVQRKQLLEGINKERERLALMGLSNEEQASYINTIQKLLGGTVDDRLKQRAGMAHAASMGGVDYKTIQELDRILLKGGAATDEERKYLAETMQGAVSNFDDGVKAMYANGQDDAALAEINAFEAGIKGFESQIAEFRKADVSSETKGVTDQELNKRIAAARLDGDAVTLVKGLNQLESALKNPMVQTAAGVAALVALTSIQVARNNKFLDFFRKGKSGKPNPKDFVGPMPRSRMGRVKDAGVGVLGKLKNLPGAIVSSVSMMPAKAEILKDSVAIGMRDQARNVQMGISRMGGSITSGMDNIGKSVTGSISSLKGVYSHAAGEIMPTQVTRGPNAIGGSYRDVDGRYMSERDGVRKSRKARSAGRKAVAKQVGGALMGATGRGAKSVGKGALAVGKLPFTALGKVGGAATKAVSSLAGMGVKAIPVVGAIVTGLHALHDGFKAADNAAQIFEGEIGKEGVTTAMKISAGIAGGLSALTFGLVDTNSMADTLHEYFRNGGERIKFAVMDGMHTLKNTVISFAEMIPNQLMDGLGYLGSKIVDGIFAGLGMLYDLVTGTSNEATSNLIDSIMSFGGSIGGGIVDSFKFLGDTIMKFISKGVNYLLEKIDYALSSIPGVDSMYDPKSEGALDGFAKTMKSAAEAQVKFGNRASLFDKKSYEAQSTRMAEEKLAEEKRMKAKRDAYATRDKEREMQRRIDKGEITQAQVDAAEKERLTKIRMEAIKNLGQVNSLNASLSKEQLAAQGVTDLSVERARWKLAGVNPNDKALVDGLAGNTSVSKVTPTVVEATPAVKAESATSALGIITDKIIKFFDNLFGDSSPLVTATLSASDKISTALNKDVGIESNQWSQISRGGRNYELTAEEDAAVKNAQANGDTFYTPARIQDLISQYDKAGIPNAGFSPEDSLNGKLIGKHATSLNDIRSQGVKGFPIDSNKSSGVLSIAAQQESSAIAARKEAEKQANAKKENFVEKADKGESSTTDVVEPSSMVQLLKTLVSQGEQALVLKEQQNANQSLNALQGINVAGGSHQDFFNKKTGFA